MLLVVAMPDLALRLSRFLPRANYVLNVGGDDGKELRHQVYKHQPDVLILDWRVGGNLWRVIDEVPAIISRTASQPHVIAMLPWTSRQVEQVAAESGCFEVVNVSASGFDRDVLSAVAAARRDRYEQPPECRRVARGGLH